MRMEGIDYVEKIFYVGSLVGATTQLDKATLCRTDYVNSQDC
jgi:hypothetical protein